MCNEMCPHCEHEVEIDWNVNELGFETTCPHCGKKLMLCDECQNQPIPPTCNWNARTDSCRYTISKGGKE